MFARLFRRAGPDPASTAPLYDAIVAQARRPAFYEDAGDGAGFGVPDTLDGRYEMLVVHAVLVLRRLGCGGRSARGAAQDLTDRLFADMDANLRELGAGDLGVRRRIQKMAEAFYGRAGAYEQALAAGDGAALASALSRNLYATAEPAAAQVGRMAAYVLRESRRLDAVPPARLAAGEAAFGPPDGWPDDGPDRGPDSQGPDSQGPDSQGDPA